MGHRPVPAAIAASRIALQWFLCQAALISCFASWKAVQPVFGQGGSGSLVADDLEALLAIKASLTDPFGALQSWNATGIGACQGVWAGVKCVDGEVTVLQLAGLGLGGTLSDQVGRLRNLRKLNVHTNQIGGPIPSPLASLAFLRAVYLHKNQFTGEIPEGLGVSALLQRVDLSSNQLTGPIPEGLAMSRRLLFVNVSDNMLSGPVPQDWAQNPSVQVLSAARNELSGPLPEHWSTDQLQILELNGNSLNGNIPAGLGESSSLTLLNLEDNQFSGAIPPELGSLTSLQFLDVSGNRLTGTIPESLKNLPNLSTFDVSSNGLGGPIPVLARTFPSSSFAGNPGLCGVVGGLGSSCPGRKKDKKLSALAWVGIGLAIAIFTVGVAFIFALIVWRLKGGRRPGAGLASKRPDESPGSEGDLGGKLVHFDGPLAFTVDDLLRATAEVLGKSSYGTVYKATLEDGNSVAVKRLREGIVKGQKEFEAEIESLGALRHDNLLSLRAYYWGPKGEKLLVYDFMPVGSLAAFLHGSQTPLGWHTRLKIATGTARGLAFLHVKEKIVHGNLTSSNVLLNRHMVPQISDYGLARVMTTSANSTVIATAGALGYRAPELTKLKKATFKSDVYSFGVILLELLTGKAPSDAMTGNSLQSTETTLPDWVASVVKEEWTIEVFDVDLMKDAPAEDEHKLLTALQLALNCVVGTPAARPEMDEVVLHLEELSPAPLLASSAHQQPLRQDL